MANTKSAKRQIRVQERKRVQNLAVRSTVKTALKKAGQASGPEAQPALREAVSLLDRAVAKGIIHKNKAARKKSRLARRLNSASAS
ncbi:MAG: 30S ribosomal protein S20 [Armatimonadetes bacterium]|nr:30S ribosomal protein S20 [Armatimonadota bacterium]